MPLSDRLRRLERDRPDSPVEVWLTEPDGTLYHAPTDQRLTAEQFRRLYGEPFEVTLTIDRAGEGDLQWD